MNLCRTCRYWSVRSHMIGVGNCVNSYLYTHGTLINITIPVYTAQDFGCIYHEEGQCRANVLSPEQNEAILKEFIHNYVPLPLKQ